MRKGDGNINWRCKEKEKERNVYRKRVKEGDKTSAIQGTCVHIEYLNI